MMHVYAEEVPPSGREAYLGVDISPHNSSLVGGVSSRWLVEERVVPGDG